VPGTRRWRRGQASGDPQRRRLSGSSFRSPEPAGPPRSREARATVRRAALTMTPDSPVPATTASPLKRREIIEALRIGAVPRRGLELFATGLDRFEEAI